MLANRADTIVEIDPIGAIELYEAASALVDDHRIRYKLAEVYRRREQWLLAIDTLRSAIDAAPSYANYWFTMGDAMAQLAVIGQAPFEEAVDPLETCIRMDPNLDACHHILGQVLRRIGHRQRALFCFTQAVERRPTETLYFVSLADLYLELGQPREANQVLQASRSFAVPGDEYLPRLDRLRARARAMLPSMP